MNLKGKVKTIRIDKYYYHVAIEVEGGHYIQRDYNKRRMDAEWTARLYLDCKTLPYDRHPEDWFFREGEFTYDDLPETTRSF